MDSQESDGRQEQDSKRLLVTESEAQLEPQSYRRRFYWRKPISFLLFWIIGFLLAIGHHMLYRSLDGTRVSSVESQQMYIRAGTIFALSFTAFTRLAGGGAYRQIVWMLCQKKSLTIRAIDQLFDLTTDLLGFISLELYYKASSAVLLAFLVW